MADLADLPERFKKADPERTERSLSRLEERAEKMQERINRILPQNAVRLLQRVTKLAREHREEFNRRYAAYYPAMKDHLKAELDIEPHMPTSEDEMWEIWIKVILPREDEEGVRQLERHDFTKAHYIIANHLKETFPEVKAIESSISTESKPKRELSKKCLDKLKEITTKRSKLGIDDTFEKAYESECCQYEIVDKERKKIGSYYTLRNRVQRYYPEIYDMAKAEK